MQKNSQDILSEYFNTPSSAVELQEVIEFNLNKYGKLKLTKEQHKGYKKGMNSMFDTYERITGINAYIKIR